MSLTNVRRNVILKTFRGATSNDMLRYDTHPTLEKENSDGTIIYVETNDVKSKKP